MAALYEGYTLCGLVPDQNLSSSGIQGIEEERDRDHVVVTDSTRSVTLYKVSDQKPLGSWTVKQGQKLTCPAVFNSQTNEYVAVTDNKVIRIWKEDDILLDKAFKATVSSDVWKVHCTHGGEPVVLFQRGAVRLLDSLLAAPQQPIEEVLAQEEAIRSMSFGKLYVDLILELYLSRLNPNSVQRYRLEREEPGLSPLSFSATYRDKHICLLYLCKPHFPCIRHKYVATVLNYVCIIFMLILLSLIQLWSYSNKVFIPHGKTLSIIPFECPKSSLASALGKLKHTKTEGELNQTCYTLTAPVEEIQKEVEGFLTRAEFQDLQPSVGQLALTLVSRSLADPAFYSSSTLAQLVHTRCLCHSVCPDLVLLALEKKDYFLCQLCLQFFPDIPEAVTCACLKAFISIPDVDAEKVSLEPDSVKFMENLITRDRAEAGLQNGFSPTSSVVNDRQTRAEDVKKKASAPSQLSCPVGLHKAVLINEILQTPYSDTFLLPHLKDLSSQHVMLFLQYLQFLYLKYSQDAFPQMEGFRSPSLSQIMDWVCLLLDAHFTVLVMTPEAKGLLLNLHRFVKSQVRLVSELGKIEGSLQELRKMKAKESIGQYSIEIIELF
uniref:Nucleolar protein 11 n=1 Tax=Astatotilapia calliptera TaxID=8154 RepID=A0AAX7U969_ASTCA